MQVLLRNDNGILNLCQSDWCWNTYHILWQTDLFNWPSWQIRWQQNWNLERPLAILSQYYSIYLNMEDYKNKSKMHVDTEHNWKKTAVDLNTICTLINQVQHLQCTVFRSIQTLYFCQFTACLLFPISHHFPLCVMYVSMKFRFLQLMVYDANFVFCVLKHPAFFWSSFMMPTLCLMFWSTLLSSDHRLWCQLCVLRSEAP